MTIKKSQIGLEIFLCALALGIAGESLLFDASWGLGATVWIAGLTAAGLLLINRWDTVPKQLDQWLLLPLCLLALTYGWRDAGMLKFATTIGLASIFGLTMQAKQLDKLGHTASRIPGIISTGISSLLSYPGFLLKEVEWNRLLTGVDKETAKSIARGLLLVLPCLLIFGLLLSSADAGFGTLMGSFFDIDIISLPTRVFIIGIFTVIAGTYFRAIVTRVLSKKWIVTADKKRAELLMLETGIILGLVNLMFATFVFMQLGYLFGGTSFLSDASGITLASYARKGFFELVVVASLALAMTLSVKRFFKPENDSQKAVFRMLVGFQIALLLVMLVSAAQRMWLYTESFGLTELRLYTSAFMVWLAFVLGWFTWSALRDKSLLFVRGSVLAGAFVVLGLHVINPEALIARTNINRAINGATLDHHYLSTLSADAVPTLLKLLPNLPEAEQRKLTNLIISTWQANPEADWRSWNLSEYRAAAKLEQAYKESQNWPAMSRLP